MYVCLCNGLTDRDIRRAADQGCTTVASVYRSLESEVNCGRCVPLAKQLIDQQRDLGNRPQQQAAE
jgi:bacterioferritin-associated ferredoxin